MSGADLYLILLGWVVLASGGIVAAVARLTRGITFFSINTDNSKMVRQAAALKLFGWLSAMHRPALGRAQCREYWVFFLSIMQRILKDKHSDAANVRLALVSHGVSAVLLYGIVSRYGSPLLGLFISVLYLSSFWPVQVSLYVGHVLLSQAFFLLAVAFTLKASAAALATAWLWDLFSGMAAAVSFFSSSSSRKYIPLFLGAFFVRHLGHVAWPSSIGGGNTVLLLKIGAVALALAAGIASSSKPLARILYHRRFAFWMRLGLGELSAGRDFESFARWARNATRFFSGCFIAAALYLWATAWFATSLSFYASHLFLFLGAGLVFLHVMLPNLLENCARFWFWFNMSSWGSRFQYYRGYFTRIGKPIPNNMRGAGFPWLIRFFFQVTPLVAFLWIGSLVAELCFLLGAADLPSCTATVGIFLLSLSPLLVAEWTRCSQASRPYFPCFMGFLVLIGHTAHRVDHWLVSHPAPMVWWGTLAFFLGGSLIWNLWVFLEDLWPARMAPAWLGRALRRLGVKKLYTYDTPYNEAFLSTLPREELDRYEIRFIKSLSEVKGDVVVVPGTSAKALNMESQRWAIEHGDFDEDAVLTSLLRTRQIQRYALASFKTMGTSNRFVHESDVLTYRSLILREIADEDRWRSRGWILDGEKMCKGLLTGGVAADAAAATLREGMEARAVL